MKRLLMMLIVMLLAGAAHAADAKNWKLVWSDEFTSGALDRAKWDFQLGGHGWGNNELEYYTDRTDNAYVKDGMLHIRAAKERFENRDYTSARLYSKGRYSKRYGRFEWRAKLPLGKGLWPALWLMPEQSVYGGWPASGEIDVMEARGQEPNKVLGTIHFGSSAPRNVHIGEDYILPGGGSIADFHEYALEWEPGVFRWYVDGKLYETRRWWWSCSKKESWRGRNPRDMSEVNPWPAPFDQPFHMIMNLAVGGNFLGNPDAATPFPAEMVVDYVRVYDKVGGYGQPLPPEPRAQDKIPFGEPAARKGKRKAERATTATLARGADVSWLPEMEADGVKFCGDDGKPQDCLQILKDHGLNAIRLRVWVNPAKGWCDQAHTVAMAKRAQALGFRLMIDFHYSDYWADPGKQNKPAAWKELGFEELKKAVYQHTRNVMSALKAAGVTPEWVQVGNETNDGMLWEDGRASKSFKKLTELLNQGHDAIKAVSPSSKVILHVSNGYDAKLFRWFFDGVNGQGARYDVIGMSLYPGQKNWAEMMEKARANMNDLAARYGKEVMVCEVGMNEDQAADCRGMLDALIKNVRAVPGGKGLGVFYWEPQCYGGWRRYRKGAFDPSGKPTAAMDAFLEKKAAD